MSNRQMSSVSRAVQFVSRPGCYSLVIDLKQRKKIRIGKLGEIEFQPGHYVYTGSAMAGLRPRLLRHLSNRKKLRWHIDYFLQDQQARVKKIFLYPAAPGQECRQNQRIGALRGAQFVRRKFGASDCKSGCASHLIFFPREYRPRMSESNSS
ncbi:MAG TPA: GIY-YIG nuclease family protein [Candidatus Acidoferrales bacterium]|nr:GIY-YIG nuclease family protein [Candidatus Acidoferrales bacterium]